MRRSGTIRIRRIRGDYSDAGFNKLGAYVPVYAAINKSTTCGLPIADADAANETPNRLPARLISPNLKKTNAGLGRLILSPWDDTSYSSGQHESPNSTVSKSRSSVSVRPVDC